MAPSQEESDQFIQAAIDELHQDQARGKHGKFAENVSKVGEWAIQVDAGFSNVTRGLEILHKNHGADFPDLGDYYNEWTGYNKQWDNHLTLSRDVASEHALALQRFDEVFLDLVEEITTNKDREEAIVALGKFAKEEPTESKDMADRFLTLKGDIQGFVARFEAWVKQTRTELKQEAQGLQQKIEELTESIEKLDKEIIAATAALLASAASSATLVGILGLVVSGTTLAVLIAQRISKTQDLSQKQKDLAEVNRKQKTLAEVKTQFDGLKPDIAMICSRLALFGEIWQSVQAQTLKFQETLKGGMEATTNERFKREVRLARMLCTPLVNGLEAYASQLRSRQ